MKWKAVWDNNEFLLEKNIDIEKSSREVSYADLVLDFSNCTIKDIPRVQQEVKIYNENNKLKFTGFVSDYKLPELKKANMIQKELTLSLFSPRQMATKRLVTIVRTASFTEILNQTLAPLFEDGFSLKELNVTEKTITVNLISRTVEEVLNYFSNKYSLYWNIDEYKKITINNIEYQFNKPAKKYIDINNYEEEVKGLISISPSVQCSDYANIINVKNARIFYESSKAVEITLKNGDRLDFENPIDISLATAKRVAGKLYTQGASAIVTNLQISCSNGADAYIIAGFNTGGGDIEPGMNFKNIATDDSTGAMFVLDIDNTFKNLATGVTYKGEGTATITTIISQTYLRYANMKLVNWEEIEKNAGVITPSGQIEKTVDVQEKWFTIEELIDYIRNLFRSNDKETNQINLLYDKENDIEVGDRLEINLEEYFTKGNFIVTAIKESKEGNFPSQYNVELRNTNLLENYIDLFRSSDTEEQTSQIELEYVVEYAEEETIKEIHEVKFSENMQNHTLNFNARNGG